MPAGGEPPKGEARFDGMISALMKEFHIERQRQLA